MPKYHPPFPPHRPRSFTFAVMASPSSFRLFSSPRVGEGAVVTERRGVVVYQANIRFLQSKILPPTRRLLWTLEEGPADRQRAASRLNLLTVSLSLCLESCHRVCNQPQVLDQSLSLRSRDGRTFAVVLDGAEKWKMEGPLSVTSPLARSNLDARTLDGSLRVENQRPFAEGINRHRHYVAFLSSFFPVDAAASRDCVFAG